MKADAFKLIKWHAGMGEYVYDVYVVEQVTSPGVHSFIGMALKTRDSVEPNLPEMAGRDVKTQYEAASWFGLTDWQSSKS